MHINETGHYPATGRIHYLYIIRDRGTSSSDQSVYDKEVSVPVDTAPRIDDPSVL